MWNKVTFVRYKVTLWDKVTFWNNCAIRRNKVAIVWDEVTIIINYIDIQDICIDVKQ